MIEIAVQYQTSADARADRDADDIARATCGAAPPFADCRAIGIVIKRRWEIDGRRNAITQWEVAPAEVGCDDDDAFGAVERAGRAHADAEKIGSARAGLFYDFRDDVFNGGDNAIRDGDIAHLGLRKSRSEGENGAAVDGKGTGGDVRAAEVDAYDVLH